MKTTHKLFLLDAYALIYRAYYALIRNPRINSKGFNTSAILGFVNTLEEVLKKDTYSQVRRGSYTQLPHSSIKSIPQTPSLCLRSRL